VDAYAPALIALGFFLGVVPCLSPRDAWARVLVSGIVIALGLGYLWWRLTITIGGDSIIERLWVWFCFAAEAAILLDGCVFFFMLSRTRDRVPEADRHEAALRQRPQDQLPHVDILIPSYNEGLDVLERSIVGALGVDYPHRTVWVLDDGKRDWLREFCESKGARYVRREKNIHAKAGNINHALGLMNGEFTAIFDADFVAHRNFLRRTVGFFDDPTVGCVQTPQHFFNKDPVQLNLGIERVWPDEQRLFFDVILPSRDAWGAAFCCGSGAVFRRATLDAIGGIPTDTVTEDTLCTLVMQRIGQRTIYLNEKLSLGLAPENVEAFFVQRKRWCRGNLQGVFVRSGPLGPNLPLLQRILFMPTYWMLQPVHVLWLVAPLVYLYSGISPIRLDDPSQLFIWQVPYLIACLLGLKWFAPHKFSPVVGTISAIFTSIRLSPTTIASLIKPFGVGFKVTPKGRKAGGMTFDRPTAIFAITLFVATVAGTLVNSSYQHRMIQADVFFPVGAFWALVNGIILFLVVLLSIEKPRRRAEERFRIDQAGLCSGVDATLDCRVADISLSGARLSFKGESPFRQGGDIALNIVDVGRIDGQVMWTAGREIGVRFRTSELARARLLALVGDLARESPGGTRRDTRVQVAIGAECLIHGAPRPCVIENASLSGAFVRFDGEPPAKGTRLSVEFPGVGSLEGSIARIVGNAAGIHFHVLSSETRDFLIRRLFADGAPLAADADAESTGLATAVLRRTFGRGA